MKLWLSLMLVFLSFSLQPQSLFAEEALDEVTLLYAQVPETWEAPHVWAFTEDGEAAYALLGWPGKAMMEDPNNEGWFYLYIPSHMDNVIINANGGSVQTDAFALTEDTLWVSISLEEESVVVALSNDPLTSGESPEYVPTQYVFAYVPIDWDTAAVWAWLHPDGVNAFPNWPGEEMTLLSDGWFRLEVPRFVNRVIINNFSTTNGQQTVDLEIGDETVYILIDTEANPDGQFEAEIFAQKPVILGPSFIITIDAPATWETPHVWSWSHPDGTNVFPSWPGEPAEYNEDTNEWFVRLPIWANRIIINNGVAGAGGEQTVDVALEDAINDTILVGEIGENGQYTAVMASSLDSNDPDHDPTPDPDPDPTPDPQPDPQPDPADETTTPLGLWIGLGVAGTLVLAGVAFFLIKRK